MPAPASSPASALVASPARRRVLGARAPAVVAVALVALLAFPTVAPAADAAGQALDRRQRIDVVHVPSPEAAFVTASLVEFAKDADLNLRVVRAEGRGALLAAVRASRASLLIVVAHGATPEAGPDSGLLAGPDVVSREAILEAVQASGAKRFLFAVCGLGLPNQLPDGRLVTGFEHRVDMKIAALSAISSVGDVYAPATTRAMVPQAQAAVARLGTPQDLLERIVAPVDALDPRPCNTPGCNQPRCYYHGECDWDRADEERYMGEAAAGAGGILRPGDMFTMPLERLQELGLMNVYYNPVDGYGAYGNWWSLLVELDFSKCRRVIGLFDFFIPGYTGLTEIAKSGDVPGLRYDFGFDVIELRLCAKLYFGQLYGSQSAAGGGRLSIQLGSPWFIRVSFGVWELDFGFWIGVVGDIDMIVSNGSRPGALRLNFDIQLYALFQGMWGWGDGSLRHDFNRWQRVVEFAPTFNPGGFSQASASPVAPEVDTSELLMTTTVTSGLLSALERDPVRAHRLSNALGVDATRLAPGSLIDLGHPAVFQALYSGDTPSPTTQLHPPARATATSALPECAGEIATGDPLGRLAYTACAAFSEKETSVDVALAASGRDPVGSLDARAGNLRAWIEYASVMGRCHSLLPDEACHRVAGMPLAAPDLAVSRAERAHTGASARVSIHKDVAAAWVDACGELAQTQLCAQGATGVNRLTVATSTGSLVEIEVQVRSRFEPGGEYDQRANAIVQDLSPGRLGEDALCWMHGMNAQAC